MQPKTLKNYFRGAFALSTLLLFIIFYLVSSYIHTQLSIAESKKTSHAISSQVFNSMYQVMRQGWSRADMLEFTNSIQSSFDNTSHTIEIYRGEIVDALYGEIEQKPMSQNVKQVFQTGKRVEKSSDAFVQTLTPVVAKDECLKCHTNAQAGDVLGVVEVNNDLQAIISETQSKYLLFSALILPFMLLVAYFISKHLLSKINRSLDSFNQRIDGINSVKDFKNIDTTYVEGGFREFDVMMGGINELSNKLKDVAVDKDILEFEVRLLDKLIITSEIVRDWKEYIKDLLHDINQVLPVYCLITIFKTDDEFYEIEIFWLGKPSKEVVEYLNALSKKMINEHHNQVLVDYKVNHNYSDDEKCLNIKIEDIEHEAKSLLLSAPKIGGIVGLGIQAQMSRDSIYSIVIDSILTTLLNLVGSVKAIHKYTENLEFYATRDPLTGLFSQRVFRDLLGYEAKRASRHEYEFGLLVIDCDNFKPINDRYGHSFGDRFLKEFADLLVSCKRDEDILSRYGGDEFTLVLPESTHKDSYTVAKRIAQSVEDFAIDTPDGDRVNVTVSIGLVTFPHHGKDPKDLFNIADSMMYKAKGEGKNGVRYPDDYEIEEIKQQAKDNSMLVLDAIKDEKIIPHFQPIMKASSGAIEIHELLMRINIDDDTLTASQFIETAESLGVVHQMDYIVIDRAFKKIQETNYQGVLFINLSPKALIVGEFLEKIDHLAHVYNIDKNRIVFEITERETVKSFALLEKFVQNLKLEGFRFAIDDFGSGFSSFHYIKKFPIDFIKIDGDFIINIDKDKKDLAFVKSIVSLAKELGIETVAEFVETKESVKFLQEIEIDYMQGYHIGRPSQYLDGK